MGYRQSECTGVWVSVPTLACVVFGSPIEAKDSYEINFCALEAGINLINAYKMYRRGLAQKIVGEVLIWNGKRVRVVSATKVHHRVDD